MQATEFLEIFPLEILPLISAILESRILIIRGTGAKYFPLVPGIWQQCEIFQGIRLITGRQTE